MAGRRPKWFRLCDDCGVKMVPLWDKTKVARCDDCTRKISKRQGFFPDGESLRDFRKRLHGNG